MKKKDKKKDMREALILKDRKDKLADISVALILVKAEVYDF